MFDRRRTILEGKTYIAIDLKSFYASVECRERNLDPMTTNLVVADRSRTEKTICLAVSPSLKRYGIPGRPRLFEVVQKVKQINAARKAKIKGGEFTGKSFDAIALSRDISLEVDYITAPPQMAKYMEKSAEIFGIYMKYVAPEDMHVYSVDEVFIDATQYLRANKMTARQFAIKMIRDVLEQTGITATAGIGSNMYLCKIAMDIVAKHIPADKDGVRIAELDEMTYRRQLWDHKPITDFWRVGHGYAKKLEEYGMYTMGDVARCSVGDENGRFNEALLYKLFGVNAELLIDHAWGWEPCTIADIKSYRPENNSLSLGQVLPYAYNFDRGRLIVWEMTDSLVLDLVEKKLVTDQMVLTVGYDVESLAAGSTYVGEIKTDRYGRNVPKEAHGSINLGEATSSTKLITEKVMELYDRIVDRGLLVRRMYVVANHVVPESMTQKNREYEQTDLFTDYEELKRREETAEAAKKEERRLQDAVISIKHRYGKNAILRGTNFMEGATMRDRNGQIGGHKAGDGKV